jgi:hypothetical protein
VGFGARDFQRPSEEDARSPFAEPLVRAAFLVGWIDRRQRIDLTPDDAFEESTGVRGERRQMVVGDPSPCPSGLVRADIR